MPFYAPDRPRNLLKVAERMLTHVPTTEADFRYRLNEIIRKMEYKAPEIIVREISPFVQSLLYERFGDISNEKPEWGNKIVNIWLARDVQDSDFLFP